MSSSSRRAVGHTLTKDFYRILQVSRTASTDEIKVAYRKLALTYHPDRHDGDMNKTKVFKEATEAYSVLVDRERRKRYDISNGFITPSGWYNKNRKRPPPSDYRKVYAPHPPPDGKWHDAQRHYDMHYGDGMFHEAIKSAYERANKANGGNDETEYRSPLGKGFVFEGTTKTTSGGGRRSNNNDNEVWNPYSKAPQGPPTTEYMYEEGYVSDPKTVMKRKAGVVNKLHERRQQRYERIEQTLSEQRASTVVPNQKLYEPLNQQPTTMRKEDSPDVACVIM